MLVGCIDIETTGLLPESEVCQIAVVVVDKGREIACFERKLSFNPLTAEQQALEIIGYDPRVWHLESVSPEQGLAEFLDFLKPYQQKKHNSNKGWYGAYLPVFGHNIWTFDIPRLREFGSRYGIDYLPIWPHPLDTYQLTAWLLFLYGDRFLRSTPPNYKLETIAAWLGIQHPKPHDALEDCRVNVEVARKLIAAFKRFT